MESFERVSRECRESIWKLSVEDDRRCMLLKLLVSRPSVRLVTALAKRVISILERGSIIIDLSVCSPSVQTLDSRVFGILKSVSEFRLEAAWRI